MHDLNDNDHREIDRFVAYLAEVKAWDVDNPPPAIPDRVAGRDWERRRLRAQVAIYRRIYGEEPKRKKIP